MLSFNFTFDDLIREEAYDASSLNCFAFRHGYDVKADLPLSLGNMVPGFGFDLHGVHFHNSECAYIAGMFSFGTLEHTAIQRQLAACTSGWAAKKSIRRAHESEKRADWERFNVEWMLYVVWQKCLTNEDFCKLLLSFPTNAVFVEDSTFSTGRTATLWGCRNAELRKRLTALKKTLKAQGKCKATIKRGQDRMRLGEWSTIGVWQGQNVLGKVLMACRDALLHGTEPLIDYDLLNEAHIHLFGKELSFNQYVKAA